MAANQASFQFVMAKKTKTIDSHLSERLLRAEWAKLEIIQPEKTDYKTQEYANKDKVILCFQ